MLMEGHRQVFPSHQAMLSDGSSTRNSPPFPAYYDQHLLESGLLRSNFDDMCDRYYEFQSEAGKSADPRMLTLLEFFRELYYRRRETFKSTIPSGLHDEFVELFNKIGALMKQKRSRRRPEVRTMQRSLSVGSTRTRGSSGLKMKRFKVRTVTIDGGGNGGAGGGQTGQGDKNKTISSK